MATRDRLGEMPRFGTAQTGHKSTKGLRDEHNLELWLMKAAICKTTNLLYVAASACAAYLALCWLILFFFSGQADANKFVTFFVADYRGFLTGVPILTLYLISERFLPFIPITIARCISYKELKKTNYHTNRKSYSSTFKAIAQSSCYFAVSYLTFSVLSFDQGSMQNIMLNLYSSSLVYLVCYVARKLYHIGRMLESIRSVDVDEKLFSEDRLSWIVVLVNIFTFSMIVALLIYTIAHYSLTYMSDIIDPSALKILVDVPILLILPVLVLFNFEPRSVVNTLYLSSINKTKARLSSLIENSDLTELEKNKQLIDYEKFLKDELRYHHRLAFTEAPVILTIVISVIALIIKML